MTIPDPTSSKKELRRLVRAQTSPQFPADASTAIVARIREILADSPIDGPIAIFAALRDEPDLLPLLASHPSACWLLPRVDGNSIVLHRVTERAELSPGCHGILEPEQSAPVFAPDAVSAFICPGVAFAPDCQRLGRGGGYYDRLLADRAPDSLIIGVGSESQLVDTIPTEPHDIRMDLVVTERRLLRAG